MSAVRFPTEILHQIVDMVWDEPADLDFYLDYRVEYRTWCALAMTCHGLLPRSRQNLLRRVSILTSVQLRSFATMLDTVPANKHLVDELSVLSIADKPSPAESMIAVLAAKLPRLRSLRIVPDNKHLVEEFSVLPIAANRVSRAEGVITGAAVKLSRLRSLRIRMEMMDIPDIPPRPTFTPHTPSLFAPHPPSFAALTEFKSVSHLQLFALQHPSYRPFLRLLQSLTGLHVLQCMQVWFHSRKQAHFVCEPDTGYVHCGRLLQLHHLDLAFMPRSVMGGLLRAVVTEDVKELAFTLNRVASEAQTREYFYPITHFKALETFTFFVTVKETGAEYTDLVELLSLLSRNVRLIVISHYVYGPARNHLIAKQTMLDALKTNANQLQVSLSRDRFPHGTRVEFQFQDFRGSEGWWTQQLAPILPELLSVKKVEPIQVGFSKTPEPYFSVRNVTDPDWSPWADDKDRSADF